MSKVKNNNKSNSSDTSSASSTPTDILENENEATTSDINEINKSTIIEYKDCTIKSVFNYKDFKLENSNFQEWFEELNRHLIAQDYDEYINKEFVYNDMTRIQIKLDNAVQSIITGSLHPDSKKYLKGCKTAYQMIRRLKNKIYKSGESLFNILEQKIKI